MSGKLTIGTIYVKNVEWGGKSLLENGNLTLNKEELLGAIAADRDFFGTVELHIVRPGDSTRLLAIEDVMQPRCKADAPETSYPGLWGKLAPAGEGTTLALKGVVVSDIYYEKLNIKWYLDMKGECAKYSQFSKQFHVVLDAKPKEGVEPLSYARALKHASLTINVMIAKLGLGQPFDTEETFSLGPVGPGPDGKPLPRVAYAVVHAAQNDTWNFLVYGQSALGFLPTVLQPTEILDGAMIWRYWEPNYYLQNENCIMELMRRHGKDLEFVGCVISNNVMRIDDKEAMAMMAARLCRDTLKADCVLVNKSGMGHAQLDASLHFIQMEKMGLPAVVNLAAVSNDKPCDNLVVFNPKVDAVINSSRNYILHHERVETLIGDGADVPSLRGIDPWGPFEHTTAAAYQGHMNQLGDFFMTADPELTWKD